MTIILHELPYYDAVSYVDVGRQLVQALPHQIIVWVSLSLREDFPLPVPPRRFPVVLDPGSTFGFAIGEKHLEAWSGLNREGLDQLGSVNINRVKVPRVAASVWLHPNKKGERDIFRRTPPFRLAMCDGVAVYPATADLPAPRLPILGLRAIDENKLQCFVYGERMRVTLRTAPMASQSTQAGNS